MRSLLFTRHFPRLATGATGVLVTSAILALAASACSKSKAQPETETPAVVAEPVAIEKPPPVAAEAVTGEINYPNLQVLPKGLTEEALSTVMKGMSDGLGVQCDHCHNVENMGEETEMKGKARSMIEMTMSLDKEFLRGKGRLACATCHKGQSMPAE